MQDKLPKQWKHWLKKARLKTNFAGKGRRGPYASYCLQGHDRLWRVNNKGMFQVSCPLDQFDRWANSMQKETTLPTSFLELQQAIKELLKDAE